jgi:hypothetical protein
MLEMHQMVIRMENLMVNPTEDLKIKISFNNKATKSNSKILLLKFEVRSSCCFFVIVSLLLLLIVVVILDQRMNNKCTYNTHDHQEWKMNLSSSFVAVYSIRRVNITSRNKTAYTLFSLIGQWWWHEKDKERERGRKTNHSYKVVPACRRRRSTFIIDTFLL